MQARIKQDSKYKTMRLFFGREFNQVDWTDIPEGFESQAEQDERLDVRLTEDVEAPVNAVRGKAVTPAAPVGASPVLDKENIIEVSADVPVFELTPTESTAQVTKTFTAPAEEKNTPRNRHGSGR